jgi:hypothetical protein
LSIRIRGQCAGYLTVNDNPQTSLLGKNGTARGFAASGGFFFEIAPVKGGIARQRRITTKEADQQGVQRLANEYEKASRKAEFKASTSAFGSMILGIATAACQLVSGRLVKIKS